VEYVLNHRGGTLQVHEVFYMKFCNSITRVVFLFDHIRCTLWTGLVEHFLVALFINTIQHWLSFTKSVPIQSLYKGCCNIIYLTTTSAYAIYKCFCSGVPITHLQHHNKHEYNIDSLWNIQFANVLLQHYITYIQQHKQYKYNTGKIWL